MATKRVRCRKGREMQWGRRQRNDGGNRTELIGAEVVRGGGWGLGLVSEVREERKNRSKFLIWEKVMRENEISLYIKDFASVLPDTKMGTYFVSVVTDAK